MASRVSRPPSLEPAASCDTLARTITSDPRFADYAQLREAHHSERTLVLRAQRRSDAETVILKCVAPGCGDPSAARLLRWEYEVLQRVRGDGVMTANRLVNAPSGPVLELQDLGSTTLANAPQLADVAIVNVGIELATVLERVHRLGVLHRDLHPQNVAYSLESGRVTLLDFDAAARVEGRVVRGGDRGLGGAFGYWAPEQTGRISVPVDRRTDLYSVGAVLYRLLTGRAPGATEDALSAVHAALAVVPPLANTLRAEIPATLARIVARLLAKVPEDRYQGAAGLLADLIRARDELRLTSRISDFTLGTADVSEVFSPSRRLYGRASVLSTLGQAFRNGERSGHGAVVSITGTAGVGKSALVAEGSRHLAAAGGWLAAGRYDQTSPAPLSGFVEALHAAIRAALTLPERELAALRARVLDAVEEAGPAFLELVPKLNLLVGTLPPVPELPPAEARNRTLAGLDALARALHHPGRLLVLFLDDLQWADAPSLELLERLLLTPAGRPMLMLAWRDTEVDDAHPLTTILRRLPPEAVESLHLEPLALADVTELVADSLGCLHERAAGLAGPLAAKSAGNPYFVLQLMESLHERGGLSFDAEARGWVWSDAELARIEMADNLADLLAERLAGLPPETRRIVSVAARLGQRIPIPLLCAALGDPPADVLAALDPAFVAGHLTLLTEQGADGDSVGFAHHRVARAALALQTAAAWGAEAVRVAHRLAATSAAYDAFVVAERCIEALAFSAPGEDAIPFARALTRAARAARLAGATAAALGYAEHAAVAIAASGSPGGARQREPELWLELHCEGARASVTCLDREPNPDFIAALLANVADRETKTRVQALKIERHLARWENEAALDGTIATLAELGVHVPRRPNLAHVLFGLTRTALTLWRVGDARLSELPVATDPQVLAAQELLLRSITAAYYSSPNLLSLVIVTSIDLAVARGIGPPTGWAFSTFAFIQAVILGRLDRGLFFAELARTTLRRTNASHLATRVGVTVIGFVESRHGRLSEIGGKYQALLPQAIADGDWEYAALCANNVVLFGVGGGVPLDELVPTAEQLIATCVGLGHRRQIACAHLFAQMTDSLAGGPGDASAMSGRFMTAEDMAGWTKEFNDPNLISTCHAARTVVNTHLGEFDRATAAAADMEPFLSAHPGAPQAYWHLMCGGVSRALAARGQIGAPRRALLAAARRARRALVAWVKASPHNHEHRLLLVDGALAATAGDSERAVSCFEAAARLALQGEFIADAGLAMQLAG